MLKANLKALKSDLRSDVKGRTIGLFQEAINNVEEALQGKEKVLKGNEMLKVARNALTDRQTDSYFIDRKKSLQTYLS